MPTRVLSAVLLGCLSLAFTGCIKVKQVVTLNPDGSGKIQMTIAMSQQMLAMAQPGQDPFAEFNVEELTEEEDRGFVAFTEPEIEVKDGYKFMTLTGYFEDINQVEFGTDENDADSVPMTFAHTDGQLTVTNGILVQMAADDQLDQSLSDPSMQMMMSQMLAGMEVRETYVLPGAASAGGGLVVDGNQASGAVTGEMLLAGQSGPLDALEGSDAVVIEYDGDDWPTGSQAAWSAELAAAKAAWAELKATAGTP